MSSAGNPLQRLRDTQHFGEEGGVVPVIDVAATSTFLDPELMDQAFQGEAKGCYLYSRHSNPSVAMFGQKLAAMEGMEAGMGVASGMAAIASVVEHLASSKRRIVASSGLYGGTYALFKNIFPKRGIGVTFVDPRKSNEVERALGKGADVLYVESVSNPLLTVSDLPGLSDLAHKAGAKLVVDNTFSPLSISPIEHGADAAVYSCTKYLSGSADLIAGAILGTKELMDGLLDLNEGLVMLTGPVMDPRVAHELYLRLDHLALRMRAHSEHALFLANALVREGISVIYPGLSTHPDHEVFKKISRSEFGFGGMMVVQLEDDETAHRLAKRLQEIRFGLYAVSLGFSRTLMSVPSSTTSSEIPPELQEKTGLLPGMLRLSVGYTGLPEVMTERFLNAYREIV